MKLCNHLGEECPRSREMADAKSLRQECDVFKVSKEASVAGLQYGQRDTSW